MTGAVHVLHAAALLGCVAAWVTVWTLALVVIADRTRKGDTDNG